MRSADLALLDLAALVDLEWLLRDGPDPVADESIHAKAQAAALRAVEERGVAAAEARARIDEDRGLRETVALAWLDAVRARRDDLPGLRVGRALTLAAWVLFAAGLLFGTVAARAFLAYDGASPVNVLPFAGTLFLGQAVLILAMLWFVVRARRSGARNGLLHGPIAMVAGWCFGKRGHDAVDALRAMRSRRSLYADVERWTLFALAQRLGVGFNLGAIVASLQLVVFSDLVFCWSTTLELGAPAMHRLAVWLSLPFGFVSSAVPTLEVVQASQWARMPGAFVGGTSPEEALKLAARWWEFLVLGLIAWGFVPRLAALVLGEVASRRALRSAGCDHAGYQQLFDRLLPRAVGWAGPTAGDVVGAPPQPGRGQVSAHAPAAAGAPTWLLVWGNLLRSREAVRAAVARRFGANVRTVLGAGGEEVAADEAALVELRKAGAARVHFVAAAGQQPTADVVDFLRRVRAILGANRPFVVSLLDLGPDGRAAVVPDDELAIWRRALGALDDPYLWVEALDDAGGGA